MNGLLYTIFESILPLFIMVALWFLLSKKLKESSRDIIASSDAVKKQIFLRNQRVVQVIKILIILFGIFMTLPLVLKIIALLTQYQEANNRHYSVVFVQLSYLLNIVNSTVNVIVYAGRLPKFRLFLRAVFCRFRSSV